MADHEYPKEALVDGETLSEVIGNGDVLEFHSEGLGTVVVLGIAHVVRRGRRIPIVEMHAEGRVHTGRLVPNQIMAGSRIAVKNSGGKHKSPVIQAERAHVLDGASYTEYQRSTRRSSRR